MTDEQSKVFGAELRSLRKGAGFSKTEFSKLVGVSQSHENNIELGNKKPSPELAERIAKELNTTVNDMLKPYAQQISEQRVVFGRRLMQARIKKGYPTSLVAGALGIPVAVYKEYEQGLCSITEREIGILHKLLFESNGKEEPEEAENEVEEATEVEEDVPMEICNIILEHITDIKVDKETQKKIWRYFTDMKTNAEERRLFG